MTASETQGRPGRHARRWTGIGVAVLLAAAVTASSNGFTLYRIRPGDTLSEIAARYHTTVAALIRLNHLPGNGNLIIAGATLRIPRRPSDADHATAHQATFRITYYVVRPGDTLYGIAAREHASWRRIARRNDLPSSLMVVIGQRLAIPHRVSHPYAESGSDANGFPGTGGVDASRFRGYYVPSRTEVSLMIRQTAERWGLDPRLALAISYMESGFNQRMVSAYGAIGAMQVLPSTGQFVGAYIVHRRLDLLAARDNITAGVAYLSVLVRETGGNAAKAAAGYYQGLASVEQQGMFADTKRYVAVILALRNRF